MEIKVIGPGCKNCKSLLELVRQAVKEAGIESEIIYITDMADIMKTGIMQTPGLMVNGKIKTVGRVPGLKEIKQFISEEI
ncbi:MAG: thioredoxin family protein [Actinomycetota bacterium]|jgi:small redox-active disulfide protein 2|nr:thioredoxin family protein [Actinomycetota bacterium]